MSTDHIGKRIREVRKMRQLSVRQLATKAALGVSTLEKYESGDRNPSAGTVAQLARVLRVGPERLHGQPYMNGPESEEQVQAVIPELRRILLTYDNPDDLLAAPRPLEVLAAEMGQIAQMRQHWRRAPWRRITPGSIRRCARRRRHWCGWTGHRMTASPDMPDGRKCNPTLCQVT